MDAIYPYLARPKPSDTVDLHHHELVAPVVSVQKYTRIAQEPTSVVHHRVGWQDQSRQRRQQQQHAQASEKSADDELSEHHWLPTGHAVTPEAEQHIDEQGHLDIYI